MSTHRQRRRSFPCAPQAPWDWWEAAKPQWMKPRPAGTTRIRGRVLGRARKRKKVNGLPRAPTLARAASCCRPDLRLWNGDAVPRVSGHVNTYVSTIAVRLVEGRPNSLKLMARPTRFELVTSAFGVQRFTPHRKSEARERAAGRPRAIDLEKNWRRKEKQLAYSVQAIDLMALPRGLEPLFSP